MVIFQIFLKYFSKQMSKKYQLFIQIFICSISILIFTGMLFNIQNKLTEIKDITALSNIKGNINTDNITNDNYSKAVEELTNNSGDFNFCQFTIQPDGNNLTQLYIDYNLNQNIKFHSAKGRDFYKSDFNANYDKDTIPVIISKKLGNKYPLNSEFKERNTLFTTENNYLNGGATFKVVGVIDDNCKFWINDTSLVDTLNYFNVIIYPTNFKKLENIQVPYYFVNLKSHNNAFNELKKDLSSKYPKIKFVDSPIKQLFYDKLKDRIIELIFIGVFTSLLLLLSLFGFIAIIQSINFLRSKEIGIYYSVGSCMKHIIIFMLGEILIISISSISISYLIMYNFKSYLSMNCEILINSQTFFICLIVMAIYIFLSISINIITMLRKEPIDLIRN